MAARGQTLFLLLAAVCQPAFAHVPRALVEKPHQGVGRFAQSSHQGFALANSLNAPGLAESLCAHRVRSRCSDKERDQESGLDYFGRNGDDAQFLA